MMMMMMIIIIIINVYVAFRNNTPKKLDIFVKLVETVMMA